MLEVLRQLFQDTERIATAIIADEGAIVDAAEAYRASLRQKAPLLLRMQQGEIGAAEAMRDLVDREEDLDGSALKEDDAMLKEIEKLSLQRAFDRVNSMEHCLHGVAGGAQLVHDLLAELHTTLRAERALLTAYQRGNHAVIGELGEQLQIEEHLVDKIFGIENFLPILRSIVNGEAIIHRLTREQRAFKNRLFERSTDIPQELLDESVDRIYDRIDDHFRELEAAGEIVHSPSAWNKVIAHPSFLRVVEEVIQTVFGERATPELAKIIWFAFREFQKEMHLEDFQA